jgi:TetR/AcrR family transcriptional regulator, regulator of mycofactocin system
VAHTTLMASVAESRELFRHRCRKFAVPGSFWLVTTTDVRRRSTLGRPEVTTHAAIERAAFRLFAEHGFAKTSLEAIAAEIGVGRRTLFRYFQSKNDIPWGQFDRTLEHFRALLAEQPADVPVHIAIHQAVVEFNRFPPSTDPSHRERMQLILSTPELQAHSVLRYSEWRQVISEFVATRTGTAFEDLVPQVAGHMALALSMAAYEHWLWHAEADEDLPSILDNTLMALHQYLGDV